MDVDDRVVVLGEDVAVDGGVFRVTEGLLERFGEQRVIDTPLAESAIAGVSIGMAINGLRPVCEMQFSGFSYLAMHQLECHAARLRWRSQGRFAASLVARMPYGAGVRALEHHSESKEVYFAHTPGLKMVIPSSPRNARALLAGAIQDPDPVIFFEPKRLYRAFREEVPEEPETLPLGQSRVVREGSDLTLISYGAMLQPTLQAAERLAEEDGAQAEVIDLLTISPLDDERFSESARRSGRVVIVHEAQRSFGAGAEVIARLVEKAFWYLQTPPQRVTGYDTLVPFFAREQAYLPDLERIVDAARETLQTP
jgi:pyruvate dehydrogenase E1 component beta subunit